MLRLAGLRARRLRAPPDRMGRSGLAFAGLRVDTKPRHRDCVAIGDGTLIWQPLPGAEGPSSPAVPPWQERLQRCRIVVGSGSGAEHVSVYAASRCRPRFRRASVVFPHDLFPRLQRGVVSCPPSSQRRVDRAMQRRVRRDIGAYEMLGAAALDQGGGRARVVVGNPARSSSGCRCGQISLAAATHPTRPLRGVRQQWWSAMTTIRPITPCDRAASASLVPKCCDRVISPQGPMVERFERRFARSWCSHAVAVNTHGVLVAALLASVRRETRSPVVVTFCDGTPSSQPARRAVPPISRSTTIARLSPPSLRRSPAERGDHPLISTAKGRHDAIAAMGRSRGLSVVEYARKRTARSANGKPGIVWVGVLVLRDKERDDSEGGISHRRRRSCRSRSRVAHQGIRARTTTRCGSQLAHERVGRPSGAALDRLRRNAARQRNASCGPKVSPATMDRPRRRLRRADAVSTSTPCA